MRDRGDRIHAALELPDHFLVVAAGGPAGGFGAVIPPWMGVQDQGRYRSHRRLCGLRAAKGLSRVAEVEVSDEFVGRDDVRAMMRKVRITVEPKADPAGPDDTPRDRVVVTLADGRRLERRLDFPRGHPRLAPALAR